MSGCDQVTYNSVTPNVFECLKKKAEQYGVYIKEPTGYIDSHGIKGHYEWDGERNLKIKVDDKPFYITCGQITGAIHDAIHDCGGAQNKLGEAQNKLGLSHGATIIIQNCSNYDMEYSGNNICHGKFTSEPYSIGSGGSCSFRVSPDDWASIGPKGWVVYKITVGVGDIATFRIFWDHPVGSGTTRYECDSEPYIIDYEQIPENPVTGIEQTITIIVRNVVKQTSTMNIINCNH